MNAEVATSAKVFVISGPSGVGKGTTCSWLRQNCPELKLGQARSVTTRLRRPHDPNEWKYDFVDVETFQKMLSSGQILEYAESQEGSLYGTLTSSFEDLLLSGHNLLMDISVEGALFMAETYPDQAVLIFIKPESLDQIAQHMRDRGTDPVEISRRLDRAVYEELAARLADFHYVVSREGHLYELFQSVLRIIQIHLVESPG